MLFFICIKYIQLIYYKQPIVPSVNELFYLPNLLYLTIILYVSDILFGLFHETTHAITARYYGIKNININLGRRLVHIVYQTQIPNIWSLKKEQRKILYLSGMIADIFLLLIITLIGHYFLIHNMMLLYYCTRVIILALFLGILFELKLYMRTDVYYLISDIMEKPNLHQDSMKILRHPSIEWANADRNLKSYFIIMTISSFIEVYVFLKFLLPFMYNSAKEVWNIYLRYPNNDLNDYGTVFAIFLVFLELFLLCFLWVNERKKKHKKLEIDNT